MLETSINNNNTMSSNQNVKDLGKDMKKGEEKEKKPRGLSRNSKSTTSKNVKAEKNPGKVVADPVDLLFN